MAIKIIDNGSAAIVNLEKDKNEYLIVDFYRVCKIIQGMIAGYNRPVTKFNISYGFTENEHEIIADYFGDKITLNDIKIEDIIDLEDAIDDYINKTFAKNLK